MGKWSFGKRSLENLKNVHKDLVLLVHETLRDSHVDFMVYSGYRTLKEQQELYAKGLSKIDGVKKTGMHMRGRAVDIAPIVNGKGISTKTHMDEWMFHVGAIGGALMATWNRLLREKKVSGRIRWGADWNCNGVLLLDQRFQDTPHFELRLNGD